VLNLKIEALALDWSILGEYFKGVKGSLKEVKIELIFTNSPTGIAEMIKGLRELDEKCKVDIDLG